MNKKTIAFISFFVLALFNSEVFAAGTSTVDLPVIGWLTDFLADISGPVVYIFCGIAGLASLVMLAFNPGELGNVFRAFMILLFVACLATGWLKYMADATGAAAMIDESTSTVDGNVKQKTNS